MQKNKLNKDSILQAYDRYMHSARAINEITETVGEQVRSTIRRVMGIIVNCHGHSMVLDDCSVAVSTFGNFIDLYFISPRSVLRSWKPDDQLTAEERKDDQRLMKAYIRGDFGSSRLYTSLSSDISNHMMRIRLEPDFAEVADIYENDRFNIDDTDDVINIQFGSGGLIRIPKTADPLTAATAPQPPH